MPLVPTTSETIHAHGAFSQEQEQNLFDSKDPTRKKHRVFVFCFVVYFFLAHFTQEELSVSLLVSGPVPVLGLSDQYLVHALQTHLEV